MKSLFIIVFVLCFSSLLVEGNYLMQSLDSAMWWEEYYFDEANFFRARLTWEADDYGYYFTTRMRNAIAAATTAQQGAALQLCAASAADQCLNLIHRFDDALRNTQADGNRLHATVYQQLMETNVKVTDLELFYYYHNYRMEEARERYYEHHLIEMGNRWADMWFGYLTIAEALDACIAAALN